MSAFHFACLRFYSLACLSCFLLVRFLACPLAFLSGCLSVRWTACPQDCLSVLRSACPLYGLSPSLPVRCLPVSWPSCPPACLSAACLPAGLPVRLPACLVMACPFACLFVFRYSGIILPPPPATHSIIYTVPLGMRIQVEIDLVYLVFLLLATHGSLGSQCNNPGSLQSVWTEIYRHWDQPVQQSRIPAKCLNRNISALRPTSATIQDPCKVFEHKYILTETNQCNAGPQHSVWAEIYLHCYQPVQCRIPA
jgi:hypothetical protein